jgi:hypothetical protein
MKEPLQIIKKITVFILILSLCVGFALTSSSYAADEPEPSPESSKGKPNIVKADKDDCLKCHVMSKKIKVSELLKEQPSNFISPEAYIETAHGKTACTDCHTGYKPAEKRRIKSKFSRSTELKYSHTESEYRNYTQTANQACGAPKCHPKPQKDYLRGSHSTRLAKGTEDLPLCTTCHGFHYMTSFLKKTKGGQKKISAATKIEFSQMVCGSCHRKEYDLYTGNYHYKALRLGNANAPMCDDCHGGHKAKPLKAGTADAVVACKKCHKDANKNFSLYVVHLDPVSKTAPPEVLYVNLFYLVLTALIISMATLHTIILHYRRKAEKRAKEMEE